MCASIKASRISDEAKPRSSISSARSPFFPVIRYAASFCPSVCRLPFTTIAKRVADIAQGCQQFGAHHFDVGCCWRFAPAVQGMLNLVEVAADAIEIAIGARQQL